jgi:hypothetical protein
MHTAAFLHLPAASSLCQNSTTLAIPPPTKTAFMVAMGGVDAVLPGVCVREREREREREGE